ncbi:MAG: alpha/beta hydrolase [Betaproteobacteria bacterium]
MALTRELVEAGYNNRAAVPDHPQWLARWADNSAAVRARYAPALDLRYGPNAKETLDLFVPAQPARGTFLFLHGGWWRSLDKSDHSFVAPAFVDAGYAVAVANYDLCPGVDIATIVDEARRALAWLARNGAAHGANVERIVVGGHSAGGHLTAMLLATDWTRHGFDASPLIAGVSLSGLHDLRPLTLFSGNSDWRLTDVEAARLSPALADCAARVPLLIAVGAEETAEFIRQSQLLWDAWPDARPVGYASMMQIAGRHHFDVVYDYVDAKSALSRATLALFDRRSAADAI